MSFESQSQAAQDVWVKDLLDGLRGGRFLDIGANDPVVISNTYALETCLGWTGILIDNDPNCIADLRAHRTSEVIAGDSTSLDYTKLAHRDFDYLSLDVDAATLDTLKKLLADGITFRCATIENDMYRFGPAPRDAMRGLMAAAGYAIAKADVCNPESPGMPYEDWYVDPKRI